MSLSRTRICLKSRTRICLKTFWLSTRLGGTYRHCWLLLTNTYDDNRFSTKNIETEEETQLLRKKRRADTSISLKPLVLQLLIERPQPPPSSLQRPWQQEPVDFKSDAPSSQQQKVSPPRPSEVQSHELPFTPILTLLVARDLPKPVGASARVDTSLPTAQPRHKGGMQPPLVTRPSINHIAFSVDVIGFQNADYARALLAAAIAPAYYKRSPHDIWRCNDAMSWAVMR